MTTTLTSEHHLLGSRRRRVRERVRRLASESVQAARISVYALLSDCGNVLGQPTLHQPCLMKGQGSITFEEDVTVGFGLSPFFYSGYAYLEVRHPTARIFVGKGTYLNNSCTIVAEHKCIRIGRNVLVGTCVEIIDSNFHGLEPDRRGESLSSAAADVIIGDNCFMGNNVRIMKGVTIGENTVIGNSAVVVDDLPANVVAAGNPAKVLRRF